jgi:hypothetical protein
MLNSCSKGENQLLETLYQQFLKEILTIINFNIYQAVQNEAQTQENYTMIFPKGLYCTTTVHYIIKDILGLIFLPRSYWALGCLFLTRNMDLY